MPYIAIRDRPTGFALQRRPTPTLFYGRFGCRTAAPFGTADVGHVDFGRSSSFRVIPQIGPLILCLGVAVRTLQFLPLRRKLRLLWNKIVSQIAPFDFRIRKARRAILASKIPAWHKRQYAPNIWTELSAVCGMLPPCRSIACLVYPCGVKRHKPLLPGPKKKRP